ncbi:hypothetical protein [Paenibacillus sacheonensis]|uniref:Lipoprotein n=1 Tax=Paenibacillus sacheonensis TaxID=742054 RepID=A0A7X4YRW1_9BACL|nr:hypothetical protein [Paenibacillus sacheonensis]MBM7567476.1 hypothetical protein [Paenibacillus sacheonensis]NBC71420.1 hypothetical protein [Paenibacillus sacheonensis]
MKACRRGTITLLIAAMAAATGCSSSDSPREVWLDAIATTSKADSYTYSGSFTIHDIRLPQPAGDLSNRDAALIMALPILLKGAVIQVHGAVQKDPQRAELLLDATLGTGDVKLSMKLPILVTEDKIYMKVPQIPGVAVPAAVADRFIVIDAKKLAEEQGGGNVLDGEAPELVKGALTSFFGGLDDTYYSEPAAADVKNLPTGYEADRYVRVKTDESHSDALLKVIAENAIPKVVDLLLGNEAYMKSFGLTKEKLQASKNELSAAKLQEQYTIKALELTGGIKDDYVTFEAGKLQLDTGDANGMQVDIQFMLSQDAFNKKVSFEVELPKDAVPAEQWLP